MGSRRKLKRRMGTRRTSLGLIALIVLLLCGAISYKRIELDSKVAKGNEVLQNKKKELASEEKRSKEMEDYRIYVKTDQFIEEMAREKMGLVYKDEIIFESAKE